MTQRTPADQLSVALQEVIRAQLPGASAANIVDWSRTERGFSTETYLFGLTGMEDPGTQADSTTKLVFRRPPEVALFPDYDLRRQYLVMDRLSATELPVPTVRWLAPDDENPLGGPYYVMDRIDEVSAPSDFPSYHTAGSYFDADEAGRAQMWWGCVETMAKVHLLDYESLRLDFLALPKFGDRPLVQVVNYLDWAAHWAAEPLAPAFERAIAWLRQHLYEPDHVTLCWGDARMSNILYTAEHDVAGVLDWEMAYLGDHEADLAWLLFLDWACSDFEGHDALAGTPSRAETVARYEELTGWQVKNLRYNEILAAVLLAVPLLRLSTHLQLGDHVDLSAFCARRIEQLLDSGE